MNSDALGRRAFQPGPIPHNVFKQPCLDFVNSEFTDYLGSRRRFDRLDQPDWRDWFLERWGITPPNSTSIATLAQLRRLRKLIRGLLENRASPTPDELGELNAVLDRAPFRWRLEKGSAEPLMVEPAADGAGGWARGAAIVVLSYARLVASGEIARVKRCANPDCSFLFYDESANSSRRWCEPTICGNLVKVRGFRLRQASNALDRA
jgi:predicted RNA-binding Zn ribbon-like protein